MINKFKHFYALKANNMLVIVVCIMLFSACGLSEEDYQRTVKFQLDGQPYESTTGQGGHYHNRNDNTHTWEFYSNGNPPLFVNTEGKSALQSSYTYPDVKAKINVKREISAGVFVFVDYEAIEGTLTIDKFKRFTREGNFSFVFTNPNYGDTLRLTNGFYSLTNEDEPIIR